VSPWSFDAGSCELDPLVYDWDGPDETEQP
jgi:hypothetical protein